MTETRFKVYFALTGKMYSRISSTNNENIFWHSFFVATKHKCLRLIQIRRTQQNRISCSHIDNYNSWNLQTKTKNWRRKLPKSRTIFLACIIELCTNYNRRIL